MLRSPAAGSPASRSTSDLSSSTLSPSSCMSHPQIMQFSLPAREDRCDKRMTACISSPGRNVTCNYAFDAQFPVRARLLFLWTALDDPSAALFDLHQERIRPHPDFHAARTSPERGIAFTALRLVTGQLDGGPAGSGGFQLAVA